MKRAGLAVVLLAAGAGAACGTSTTSEKACSSSAGGALSVCAKGPLLDGVDVSTYQGTVDWTKVKASGRAFGIARVSDGLTHPDATFSPNWAGMKAAGLVRGSYQYFRAGQDPVKQADMVLAKVTPLAAGDLPPVIDIETADGQSPATVQSKMHAWLDRIEQFTGRKPLIYAAQFMTPNLGTGFGAYPLWVANYGVTCPAMPATWTAWLFWQSSSTGKVTGITGNVDLDTFQGTLAELTAFTGPGSGAGAFDGGAPPADLDGGTDPGATMGGGAGGAGDAGDAAAGPCP